MRVKKYGKTAHEEAELRPDASYPNDSPPPHKTNINKIKNTSKKTEKNKPEDSTRALFQCWTAPPEPITGASLLPPRHLPCKMTAGLLKGDCSAVNAHRTTVAEEKLLQQAVITKLQP